MIELLKDIYGIFFFFLFRFLPLQNKVVFCSFSGKNCEGNPRYISELLLKKRKDIKQVWIKGVEKNANEIFDLDSDIKIVKISSIRMIYEMATAKVWVDSHIKPHWIKKRKNQIYIETWHGGLGMKKILGDAEEKISQKEINNIKHNSKIADLFISNSTHLTNIYKRAFWYSGPIFECGFPKNDIFYMSEKKHKDIRDKVLRKLNISIDKIVILYAPTFRNSEEISVYNINFSKLKKNIEDKYNKDAIIFYRLHPLMKYLAKDLCSSNENVIDVSYYDDMQELIIASDVFITDYSSGIFDFAELRRPGFLYATDIEEYEKERGLYYDLIDMPFPLARNSEELEKNILEFDYDEYKKKLEKFFLEMGLKDNSHSTERIVKTIEDYIDKGNYIIKEV